MAHRQCARMAMRMARFQLIDIIIMGSGMKVIILSIIILVLPLQVEAIEIIEKGTQGLGVGFAVNHPSEFMGISFIYINKKAAKVGCYVDLKCNYGFGPSIGEYSDISPYEAVVIRKDIYFGKDHLWATANVGATFAVTSYFAIYMGVGITCHIIFLGYFDRSYSLSDDGVYWVEKSKEVGINFLGGLIFNGSKIYHINDYTCFFQIGLESHPSGVTLGLGIIKFGSFF